MEQILEYMNGDAISIVIPIVLVVLSCFCIINQIRLMKLEKRYKNFINKFESKDIEKTIKDYFLLVNQVNEENKILVAENKNIEKRIDGCIQKIGIVRYNAFEDVGSELSFAIALLDKNNNGIVLNGIYSRNSSNIYSKPIIEGHSEYVLSNEEKKAIEEAINKN